MNLPKQDRNGVRTPTDLERKYKLEKMNKKVNTSETRLDELEKATKIDSELSSISTNAVQNKVITKALGGKVDKVEGKMLSTNDFTDEDKQAIHIHDNINVLDKIRQQDILSWNTALNFVQLIANAYNEELTYEVGDFVIYDNVLYKCKIAIIEAESWNVSNWERTTVMAEVKGGNRIDKN